MGEPDAIDAIDATTMPPVYERDGKVVYRASSLGGCVRMLALARQGFDPVPAGGAILEVFEAGRRAEEQVWAKGIISGTAQDYVELAISETIVVGGHLDCWDPEQPTYGIDPEVHGPNPFAKKFGSGRVYEVKSQSEAEWKPIEQSPFWGRYKFQISVYMHATGLPLTVLRVQRRKDGTVAFEERQDYQSPPVSLAEIRARVFQVELMARRDLSGDECEKIEYPCPFYYTHVRGGEDGDSGDGSEREQVDDPAAVVLARQYESAKRVASAANARVKASRDGMLAYMGERERLGLSDGTLLTRYKVKEQHVEYDRKEYWALRVTTRKGQKGGDDAEQKEAG